MTSAASGASPRRRWRPREGDSGSSSVRRGRRGVSGACCGCAKGSGARCERWSADGTSGRSGDGSWTGQGCDGGEPGGDGQASGSGDSGCCWRRCSRDGSSRAISGGVLEFAASGSVEGLVVRVSPLQSGWSTREGGRPERKGKVIGRRCCLVRMASLPDPSSFTV